MGSTSNDLYGTTYVNSTTKIVKYSFPTTIMCNGTKNISTTASTQTILASYPKLEFRALAIQPSTGDLIGIGSGRSNSTYRGIVFRVDKTTGALTKCGDTTVTSNFNYVTAMTFHPETNDLWFIVNNYALAKMTYFSNNNSFGYPSVLDTTSCKLNVKW